MTNSVTYVGPKLVDLWLEYHAAVKYENHDIDRSSDSYNRVLAALKEHYVRRFGDAVINAFDAFIAANESYEVARIDCNRINAQARQFGNVPIRECGLAQTKQDDAKRVKQDAHDALSEFGTRLRFI